MRTVAVIQARTGSLRLPGKVFEPIGDLPLVLWTLAAMRAVPGVATVVVATSTEPADDPLAELLHPVVAVHRGPLHDVLRRLWDAARPHRPEVVVRQTADNPFVDPSIVGRQVELLVAGGLDYVGIGEWPLGVAAEVARAGALEAADREATDPAEREHVMPFLYTRPERFRVGVLAAPGPFAHRRYTVDTADDLAFARALAARLGHGPPAALDELEAIVRAEPALAELNVAVPQRSWREAELVGRDVS